MRTLLHVELILAAGRGALAILVRGGDRSGALAGVDALQGEPPAGAGGSRTPSLLPLAWLALGPFSYSEIGADPIRAFGGVCAAAGRAPADLWSNLSALDAVYEASVRRARTVGESSSSLAGEFLNGSAEGQLPLELQDVLQSFPTEVGPGGRTVWSVAYANQSLQLVAVNFTYAAKAYMNKSALSTWHGGGWAMTQFRLTKATTVLSRCTDPYLLGPDADISLVPDIYDKHESIHATHLNAGTHRIYVNFNEPGFWCDVFADSADARAQVAEVRDEGSGVSSLMPLKGVVVSDVVDGKLVSPFLGVPVLNVGLEPIRLARAMISEGPSNLIALNRESMVIASGQSAVLHLELQVSGVLRCSTSSIRNDTKVLNFTVALYTEGGNMPSIVRVAPRCYAGPGQGYLVAYSDFDGSLQHLWAAPPNLTRFAEGKCPKAGCPVLLSLHGADVELSDNWGRNYEYDGPRAKTGGFPYPAWLVEPSNRHAYGTDWQDQGFDNILWALLYVQDHLPGASALCGATLEERRSSCGLDVRRVLVTGHSMGGHGCLVFATHFPDLLVGAACNSAWPDIATYTGPRTSRLLEGVRFGLRNLPDVEHSADYLSANVRGIPMFMVYGSRDDNVPPSEPRYMARLVESMSQDPHAVRVVELPRVGHWYKQNTPTLVAFLEKTLQPSEVANESLAMPPLPETFEFTVTHPATFGSRGFLRLLRQADLSMPARFFVTRCPQPSEVPSSVCSARAATADPPSGAPAGDALWDVQTSNVERFVLQRPMGRLSNGRPWPLALRIDGALFTDLQMAEDLCLDASATPPAAAPVWGACGPDPAAAGGAPLGALGVPDGSPQRAGPMHMAIRRHPVCIVHGTGPGQRDVARELANKLFFISRYSVSIVDAGSQPMVESSPSSANPCTDANLILVGSAAENSWTDYFRCAFPYLRFLSEPRGAFALGGRLYGASGTGMLALGGRGLAGGRLALLVHGVGREALAMAAAAVPVSSGRTDADFVVFGPDYGWQGEGGILASGLLDREWRISQHGGWSEPEHSAAGLRSRPTAPPTGEDPECASFGSADRSGAFSPEQQGGPSRGLLLLAGGIYLLADFRWWMV